MIRRLFLFILLLFLFLKVFTQTIHDFLDTQLDVYIEEGMKEWNIPGLAIGIVKDGKVIKAQGYGVRAWGKRDKVDVNTLFLIGSNTKAFTGTISAWMNHEEQLNLDAPVSDYLPWFRMYDPNVSSLISTRDLLTHRSGLGTAQGDFAQWNGNLTREEMVRKMANIPPKKQFRSEYGYCNYCYVAVGEIIKAVSGESWDEQIHKRIFKPLAMHSSLTAVSPIKQMSNTASAHTYFDGKVRKVDYPNIDYISGAGSIVSSVMDLTAWVKMQLDTGRFEGEQVIPKEVVLRTWQAETTRRFGKLSHLPSNANHYGLGFIVADYANQRYLYHGGGTDGFISEVSLLPKEDLGIIILTNSDESGSFLQALKYQILAEFTHQPSFDYKTFYRKQLLQLRHAKEQMYARELALLSAHNRPVLPLDHYTGRYENEVYGAIEIVQKDGQLNVHFSNHPHFVGTLIPEKEHHFLISYNYIHWGIYPASFQQQNGKINTFKLQASDFIEPGAEYEFTKK